MSKTVVVSGSDAGFFKFLAGTLNSLKSSRARYGFDVAVLDFGLTGEQVATLELRYGAQVVRPQFYIDIPAGVDKSRALMFASRCSLPRDIPGYDIYMWIDADAWVQDDSFFSKFTTPASQGKMAIVCERESVYGRSVMEARWHYGNMLQGWGLPRGLQMMFAPPVNAGVWAMPAQHPFWQSWLAEYSEVLRRTSKINMDQHALIAVTLKNRNRVEYLTGVYNWICVRATPEWDDATNAFVTPDARRLKIAVVHLAGPLKSQPVQVARTSGGSVIKGLTFAAQE